MSCWRWEERSRKESKYSGRPESYYNKGSQTEGGRLRVCGGQGTNVGQGGLCFSHKSEQHGVRSRYNCCWAVPACTRAAGPWLRYGPVQGPM